MGQIPNRAEAWELLCAHNESEALRRHALAVEAVMRHYAELMGEDVEKWGAVGLLHDLDYEKYPDQHCDKSAEMLRKEGIDEVFIRAVLSHGWGIRTDVEPIHPMEKVLFATDELTGLINAAAIMRPSKSVMDLELKSVRKKFKTPSFAAGVDRGVIEKGAGLMGASVDDLITQCILAMRKEAEALGLAGTGQ